MSIGINGQGRIGRLFLRKALEAGLKVRAINTSASAQQVAHFLKYDSVHGTSDLRIDYQDDQLEIEGQTIKVLHEKDIGKLDWNSFGARLVVECSGRHNDQSARLHLEHAEKVLVSSPCDSADATIVIGANENQLDPGHQIISIGSCTTNAFAPIARPLDEAISIEAGYVTTVHAYTFDQNLLDNFHSDLRRARGAATSIVPTKSGLSKSLAFVLPKLASKISASAIRVPVANVSLIDCVLQVKTKASKEEVNSLIEKHIKNLKLTHPNLLNVAPAPLVSCDFNHTPFSAVFDPFETRIVSENMIRILCWYDNEWGYVNRLSDMARMLLA